MMQKLLPIFIAAIALAGCGTTDSGSNAPTTTGTTSEKPAAGGKLSVVYIPKSSGNPYFKQVQVGYEKAAKDMDFTFDTQAPASAEATSQLSVIKDQIQRGVGVIAISPNSPDALNEALDEARAKGIIVITVDADLTGNESHRDAAVLPTDFAQVGPSQLELLSRTINYEGEFAILSATTDAPNQNAWIAGMKTALKEPKYAKMKLVATVYGDDDSQKSSTEAEGLLTKYPNLRGIISPTSVGLAAAAQVIENAGVYPGGSHAKNGGIALTGLSTPDQLRKAVTKGVVKSFQLWSPEDMGYVAAYIGVKLKEKQLELKPGSKVEIKGKSAVSVTDKNVIFTGPLVTFDLKNIDQYHF